MNQPRRGCDPSLNNVSGRTHEIMKLVFLFMSENPFQYPVKRPMWHLKIFFSQTKHTLSKKDCSAVILVSLAEKC